MKSAMKRIFSLALAIVMVIGMIPVMALTAWAATIGGSGLTDTTIGLSASDPSNITLGQKGTVTWTADGTTVTCKAVGNGGTFIKVAADSTLTITNNGESGKLAFDWSLTGNGSVSGIISGNSGSYSADLAGGASTTLKVESGKGAYTCELTISNLRIIRDTGAITSTFLPGENGSYTVDGTAITTATELSKPGTESYALVATPASGYQFFGWYNETAGKYISYTANASVNLDTRSSVRPVFISTSAALFGVGTAKFFDLNEANAAASAGSTKTIILIQSGTLAAGDYTVSSGNTLLIPYDSANTIHTSGKSDSGTANNPGWVQPTAYRTLTMADGAKITVNGAINVGGIHHAANGGNAHGGSPTGSVGMIHMASGSAITVANTGKLYCWGFIYGSGTVTAKDGATVYENMQITDFRGGDATTKVYNERSDYRVFPFSQYYVQNIEVPMTLEPDATVFAATSVYMSALTFTSTVEFIGAKGLFCVSEGSVTKDYDESTDRLHLIVDGTVGINELSMKVSTMTITSSEYALPINSNINITVKSGSVCNLSQDLALLPGSQVNVEEGATLNVPAGYSIYIYDSAEWDNGYIHQGTPWIPLVYVPGRAAHRANVATDARVDLNGTLNVEGGAFTTASGADIYSSKGTGVIYMAVAADVDTPYTYQYVQASSTWASVPVTPLRLHNGNGDYTETSDAVANDSYAWNSACKQWTKNAVDEHTYEPKVIAPTCTTEGYTAPVCKYCGHEGEHTDIVPALAHTNTSVVTAPTCTEQGYTTHTCTVCGNVQVDTYVAATGHTFVAGTVVAPTCTAKGYTVYNCSCGATENRDFVEAAGHSYNAVVTAPTCTAKGYTTYTCACGDSYVGDEVNALGHTEVTVAGTPATCTATGLTDGKKCSVCGIVTVAQEVIDILPHTEVIDAAVAATCTETGLTEGKHCGVCGTVIVAQTVVDALGHSWNDGEITTAPGCESEGIKTITCGTCGETKTEAISATGHTEVEDAAVEATCTTAGKTAGTHCSVCNAILSGNEEIPALGHSYEAVVTAPTCEENGYTTYTCHCGDSYVADEVAALGHNWVPHAANPATCTEAGSETEICTNCKETKTTEIPATGHSWGEEVVVDPTCTEAGYTKKTCTNENCGAEERYDEVSATGHTYEAVRNEPTCTADGSIVYTCHCGDTYTETITAAGHTYESVVTEPTCTEQGYTTYTCSVCGDSYVDDYTNVLAHTYETVAKTVDPTCTEQGYTVYECKCGATENRDFVDALGHSYESVVTNPTCLTGGYTTHSCSRCDSVYTDSETAATGHAMGDWSTVSAATCVNDGEERRDCANCDYYETNVLPATGHSYENGTCTACGAEDPNAVAKYTVSGVITSTGSETDPITVQLVGEKTYEVTVYGNTASYSIEGVEDGTYTVNVTKFNHKMAKAATVTVSGGDAAVDVKLNLVVNDTVFKINSASLTLSEDINVRYTVTVPAGVENPYMVFTFNGEETVVTEYKEVSGRLQFVFPGVLPQYMGDNIHAVLYATYNGSQVSDTVAQYSARQYCVTQLNKSSTNEKTVRLLSDLLVYGEKAQLYRNYKTDNLVTEGLTLNASTFPGMGDAYNKQQIIGDKNTVVDLTGASLTLANKILLRLTVSTTDPAPYTYEVTINGRTTVYTAADLVDNGSGKWYLYFEDIYATEFDAPVTAVIKENGVQVSRTVIYSVNTYLYRNQNVEGTMGDMLRAIFNYGNSAANYAAN